MHPYCDPSNLFKKFIPENFIKICEEGKLVEEPFKSINWSVLYTKYILSIIFRFIQSVHFKPWFYSRRSEEYQKIENILKNIRRLMTNEDLITVTKSCKEDPRELIPRINDVINIVKLSA